MVSRLSLKIGLIVLYLVADYATLWERVSSLGPTVELAFFLGLYGAMAACLIAAALIRNSVLRVLLAALFASGSIFLHAYEWGTRQPLTYNAFLTMIDANDELGSALSHYGGVLRIAVPLGLLLFVALAIPPKKAFIWPRLLAATPVLGIALLSALLFVRGGEGARALPAPFAPIAYSVIRAGVSLAAESGPRQPVTLPRFVEPVKRDIILLVDESVSANYLDINNPGGIPTGLARARSGVSITNFGYAAAINNCSAGSNLTLRYGGTRETYRLTKAVLPSIWAYAKKAGMRTVYFDAQRTGGELTNLMTPAERAEIDDFRQLDAIAIVDRDQKLADMVAELTNNDRAEFIMVNKMGAHFPVHDKFPDAMMRYLPTMERGNHQFISDTGDPLDFKGRPEDWRRYRNSYRNTLLWNVSAFFDRLLAKADMTKATIVYTSDHGQDLHERGTPGDNTHCGSAPVQEEGLIPIVILEGEGKPTLDWTTSLVTNRNAMSAYRIFPTLLELMGYDPAAMRPRYGDPLTSAAKDDFSFNINYNAALGKKPSWTKIDLTKLTLPPVSDYQAGP
jgi:glucan phosphoethanolaminetransferase (alkaline phosphatase superfamily)